jgi:hypothetical protein
MGTSQSRDGIQHSESETESEDSGTEESESSTETSHASSSNSFHSASGGGGGGSTSGATSKLKDADVLTKMGTLSLQTTTPQPMQRVKLYHHVGGNTPKAHWVVAEKQIGWEFLREEEEDEEEKRGFKSWLLVVGGRFKARVDDTLPIQFFDDQLRVDLVWKGVWAMKFMNSTDYKSFVTEYQNHRFENIHFLEPTEENKLKVFGKDFMLWAKGDGEEESIWQDAEDEFERKQKEKELRETYQEAAKSGVQSLTMGAMDNSFLVSNSGIDVLSNMSEGVHSKGVTIRLQNSGGNSSSYHTPKKGMLMQAEKTMMLLSPVKQQGQPHASGVSQLDLGTGKTVAEWKFAKDGTPITMLDVTNDAKGSQLESSSTFMGLDDNRLVRWDMRDKHGVVQDLSSPVLNWSEGHQFAKGTNFQCFATTGDGSVVVGSRDGKVRLYGITSMRQAKTAFPGLGAPITHVDVTYDGKWIVATTDTYMILISTVFKDKDGKFKTGFGGRGGSHIAAPRILKLKPVDVHEVGQGQKFHGGQFSWITEAGQLERNLVVTVGKYTAIWNFRRVKQSDHECYKHEKGLKSCYCYKLVNRDESIVESRFMHDAFTGLSSPEAPLVVATPTKYSSLIVNP